MTQFYNSFWRRNLLVCFIGSFSTVFAMTLMLPFLPCMSKNWVLAGMPRSFNGLVWHSAQRLSLPG